MSIPIGMAINTENDHRDDGVLQVLGDAGGRARPARPQLAAVKMYEQRLLQKVHAAASRCGSVGPTSAPRVHGVSHPPAKT